MSRPCAADCWICFVLSRMTVHLCDDTASAEKGAAKILASNATLFGNGIPCSHTLTRSAKTVNAPNGVE